jgi:hypothetical protein
VASSHQRNACWFKSASEQFRGQNNSREEVLKRRFLLKKYGEY